MILGSSCYFQKNYNKYEKWVKKEIKNNKLKIVTPKMSIITMQWLLGTL